MKIVFTVILQVLVVCGVIAQQAIRFQAEVSADTINLESIIELRFNIEGTEYADFHLPSLADFYIVAGPHQSTQIQYINGEFSRKTSYAYHLQPKESGIFIIDPATIRVDTSLLETEPLFITVFPEGIHQHVPVEKKVAPKRKKKRKRNKKIYRI